VVRYAAEQILNWRVERLGGRNVVTMVVLAEEVSGARGQVAGGDEFEAEMVEQIGVLRLTEVRGQRSEGGGERGPRSHERGYEYQVEVWRKKESKSKRAKPEWVKVETRIPLRLGKPLSMIPFVFHGPRHSLPHVDKLPLADIPVGGMNATVLWSWPNLRSWLQGKRAQDPRQILIAGRHCTHHFFRNRTLPALV